MQGPTNDDSSPDDDRLLADLQELLVRLGSAMTMAGESVDGVHERLERIAGAYGVEDIEVMVLPTALFIETGSGANSRVQLAVRGSRAPRLDQITDLYE